MHSAYVISEGGFVQSLLGILVISSVIIKNCANPTEEVNNTKA